MLDYQHKFGLNSLGSINAELKTKFTKMESHLAISQIVKVKFKDRLVVTERKGWINKQYSRREFLEISGILESVSDNALEDKIQAVLRGIDAEADTENNESCHCLKGKGSKGRVILTKSFETKVFINESLCG